MQADAQAIVEFLAHACCHTSRREFCEPLRAVLRASRRRCHTAKTTIDEWAAFTADCVGIARESSGLPSDCKPDIRGLQGTIQMQRRLGAVNKPMKAEDIVDPKFLPAPADAM